MLQTGTQASAYSDETRKQSASTVLEAFQALTGLIRRRFPIFLTTIALTCAIGALYMATTTPVFTATATMVMDASKVQQYQQQSSSVDSPVDAETIQTQVQVLQSDNISLAVIRDLHLTDDPEFVHGRAGLISTVRSWIGLVPDEASMTSSEITQRTLNSFNANSTVVRMPTTYAVLVGFDSQNPDKAARIANAIVDAYISDQLDAKFQATKRASLWLQDRIAELRSQATAADRAVAEFKSTNNIVQADGRLVNEQQMSEMNSQLILAHAATAEAKARLDRINDVMKQAIPDASVAEGLHSEIIIRLRQQYLELAGRESIWSVRYGPNHLATQNLRTQMLEIQHNISDEMRKIAESTASDYQIAQAREKALDDSLKSSVSESKTTNKAQVELHDLVSNSSSSRALYENFLQRYMDAVQQQSFPTTEARIISPAVRPLSHSRPKLLAVIGASLAGGLLLSFGIAVFREMVDGVFRSGTRVEEALQLDCLATLPSVRGARRKRPRTPGVRETAMDSGLWSYATEKPFSAFAEGLRAIKIAADLAAVGRTGGTVLGITSTLPNEGKSTIASNFAALVAHAGSRVLLIDGDLRSPSLSRALTPGAKQGLVDLVAGNASLDDLLYADPESKLSFLPAGAAPNLMHTNEILSSEAIRNAFTAIRARFDYVIVDLAPLAPVVDTRTTVHFIDAFVYAVEWGRTKIDVINDVLGDAPEVQDNILGIVLNKADLSVLGRYERHRGKAYQRKYYRRYGYHA